MLSETGFSSRKSRQPVADTSELVRNLSETCSLARARGQDSIMDFGLNGQNCIRATQTGLSRTCHGLCHKHLEMVSVRNFRDLCLRLSPKLHDFMICHRLCPSVTFMIWVHDFPCGEVSVKVGVMEFGLYSTVEQLHYSTSYRIQQLQLRTFKGHFANRAEWVRYFPKDLQYIWKIKKKFSHI